MIIKIIIFIIMNHLFMLNQTGILFLQPSHQIN